MRAISQVMISPDHVLCYTPRIWDNFGKKILIFWKFCLVQPKQILNQSTRWKMKFFPKMEIEICPLNALLIQLTSCLFAVGWICVYIGFGCCQYPFKLVSYPPELVVTPRRQMAAYLLLTLCENTTYHSSLLLITFPPLALSLPSSFFSYFFLLRVFHLFHPLFFHDLINTQKCNLPIIH